MKILKNRPTDPNCMDHSNLLTLDLVSYRPGILCGRAKCFLSSCLFYKNSVLFQGGGNVFCCNPLLIQFICAKSHITKQQWLNEMHACCQLNHGKTRKKLVLFFSWLNRCCSARLRYRLVFIVLYCEQNLYFKANGKETTHNK